MADITTPISPTGANTNQNQSSGASPWDEPLDIPEEPKDKQKGPQIIGSLDPNDRGNEQEKPVPFNIPEEVVEEKVGKKISAAEVMGRDKPIFADAMPSNQGTKSSNVTVASVQPVDTMAPPVSEVSDKNMAPVAGYKTVQSNSRTPIDKKAEADNTVIPEPKKSFSPAIPSETKEPVSDKVIKKDAAPADNLGLSSATTPKPEQMLSQNEAIKPEEAKKEQGISELLLNKNDEPDENIAAMAPPANNKPVNEKAEAVQPITPPASADNNQQDISKLLLGDNDPFADPFADKGSTSETENDIQPKTEIKQTVPNKTGEAIASVVENNGQQAAAAPLQSNTRKAFDIAPPPTKPPMQAAVASGEKAMPQKFEPVAIKNQETAKSAPQIEAKKKSLFAKFNPFTRNKSKTANVGLPGAAQKTVSSPAAPQMQSPAQGNLFNSMTASKKLKFKLSPKLSIILSVLLLLAGSVYLTELGLVSFGIEKVYGAIGLEKIWGGLPKSSESALAVAAVNGQNHLNFKFKGTISATIDKTKKSPVASPFISLGKPVQPLADIMQGAQQAASLSQYDYYGNPTSEEGDTSDDSYYDDTSTSSSASDTGDASSSDGSSSVSSSSSGSSSSSSSSSDIESDITSPTPSGTENATSSSSDSTTIGESSTKQIELEITGKSNDKSLSSELILKPLVGSDKYLDLMSNAGNLYVKSDEIEFNSRAQKGKWLSYGFTGFEAENTLANFLNLNTNSGFSVTGYRQANEKAGDGYRAYKYKIENMEIGDTFSGLGISKETIQSINGYVWIGVRDHLIHKADLEIVPSISAGFSKISCQLEFYDYDATNEITLPALDNVISIETAGADQSESSTTTNSGSSASSSDTATNSAASSPTPSETSSSDNNQRISSDSQRNSDLSDIKSALGQYKERYGYYPKSARFENIGLGNSVLSKTLIPRYISSLPSDPKEAEGWWYGYKSDGKTFTLSARFENINDDEVTKVGNIYLHYVYGY